MVYIKTSAIKKKRGEGIMKVPYNPEAGRKA